MSAMQIMSLGKLVLGRAQIMHMYRQAVDDGPAGDPSASDGHAFEIERDAAIVGSHMQFIAIPQKDRRIEAVTEPGRRGNDRAEHGLKLGGRAADDRKST